MQLSKDESWILNLNILFEELVKRTESNSSCTLNSSSGLGVELLHAAGLSPDHLSRPSFSV